MNTEGRPPAWLAGRVTQATGRRVASWRHATGGYTPAERWIVGFDDGSSAFVKAGTPVNPDVAEWLRTEHRLYESIRARYLPRSLGWADDGEGSDTPVLLLEDLSAATWPPPWTTERVGRVLEALRQVASTEPPDWVPQLEQQDRQLRGWPLVQADPEPFLQLGVCSEAWLERTLPALVEAEAAARLDGDALMHVDVRSDNICFAGDRTLLVDWNSVSVGNPAVDVAFWLPSLALEGGPQPEEVLPGEPEVVALVAGFFACRAGLPPILTAPRVRTIQLAQFRVALPWASRALGLPPP